VASRGLDQSASFSPKPTLLRGTSLREAARIVRRVRAGPSCPAGASAGHRGRVRGLPLAPPGPGAMSPAKS